VCSGALNEFIYFVLIDSYLLDLILNRKVRCQISHKNIIDSLLQTLQRVDLLRKRLLDYGKNCASVCAKVQNLRCAAAIFVVKRKTTH